MGNVESISQESEWNGFHIVRFKPAATQSDKDAVITLLKNNPDYQCELDVITPDPTLGHEEDHWRIIGEQLTVTFRNRQITQAQLDDFMLQWGLELVVDPYQIHSRDLDWPYIFRNVHPERCGSQKTIDIVRAMVIDDSSTVRFAEPEVLNLIQPHSNDPMYPSMWHVENTGQQLSAFWSGNNDADCDIAEAWNKGYTGQGVNIALVDVESFDSTHPDLSGVFLSDSRAFDTDTTPLFDRDYSSFPLSHGQQMAGVISANKDNNLGGAGVVPDARIGAFLIGSSPAQGMNALIALHNDPRYPIINMSWGIPPSYHGLSSFSLVLDNHINNGRQGKGTVLIASAGNDNWVEVDFPATYPGVFAIGATTPTDSVKIEGDRWDIYCGRSWGSDYGSAVDFAAPGVFIPTTDLQGFAGIASTDYYGTWGTSASSCIATGIAAMILQNDPSLNALGPGSVFEFMRAGSEQVSGYNYNRFWPNHPGKSEEIGYGRLNACNTANLVGLNELDNEQMIGFTVHHLSTGEIRAYYDIDREKGKFNLEVIDMQGRILQTLPVEKHRNWMRLTTDNLAPAIYFARLSSTETDRMVMQKFVIFR